MKMNPIDKLAYLLLVIGGLNWGLVGAFEYNLVSELFGTGAVADTIYIIVGLAALYGLYGIVAMLVSTDKEV